MSRLARAAAIAACLSLACCARCGDDSTGPAADQARLAASARDAATPEAGAPSPGAPDATASAPPDAGAARGPSPIAIAQRFVVGWASGRVEPLLAISDGEAAEVVRRAVAGEAVDTPLGRLTPDRPLAQSYSFGDRRATPIRDGVHRIEFTLTARIEGHPITTRHVVDVRQSDGKVIAWNAPSPPPDGGV